MGIVIDDIGTQYVLPKITRERKQKTLNKIQIDAVKRYQDAYVRVYGMRPEVRVDGKWYRVHGLGYGVSRDRLREMTKALEYRAGPVEEKTK